jgi:hypothetical protein
VKVDRSRHDCRCCEDTGWSVSTGVWALVVRRLVTCESRSDFVSAWAGEAGSVRRRRGAWGLGRLRAARAPGSGVKGTAQFDACV